MKLAKLAKDFSEEENVFQRSLTIFKFIEILQKNKETKKALDSLLSETSKAMNCERLSDEDDLLCEKAGIDCDFWVCYGALDKVHSLILKFKDTQDKRYADKAVKMITASYYPEIYRICFKMVAGCLLEKMATDYLLANKKDKDEKTWFDDKKSILYINGEKILINRKNKITNGHKILHHIFITNKKNIKDNFFYSEIAFDEFEDTEYKSDINAWRKYYVACREIKNKAVDNSKKRINDFLMFNKGQKGFVKLNAEYL